MYRIFSIIRAVIFISLPVFFYNLPFLPQPLQNLMLVFVAAVMVSEAARFKIRDKTWLLRVCALPFWAALAALVPYFSFLPYFETGHQVLFLLMPVLGLLYYLEGWLRVKKQ